MQRCIMCDEPADGKYCSEVCQNNFVVALNIPGTIEGQRLGTHLLRHGWVVVPVYNRVEELDSNSEEFESTMRGFPEYLHPVGVFEKGEQYYVKGGFGAFGNPGSYHNPFVRRVRMDAIRAVAPVFRFVVSHEQGKAPDRKLEQVYDRMRVLRMEADVSAEEWHRDLTPAKYTEREDSIFGGWIPMDVHGTAPQQFSCFSGSHRGNPTGSGFQKPSKEEKKRLNQWKSERSHGYTTVQIPQGHILIFYQDLIHEVVGGRAAQRRHRQVAPEKRLFTGWRLTTSEERFMESEHPRFFEDQSVPLLKSKQQPRMYPVGSWFGMPAAAANAERWAKMTFHPALLEKRTKAKGTDQGSSYLLPPIMFYSLRHVAQKIQAYEILEKLDLYFSPYDEETRLYWESEREELETIVQQNLPEDWLPDIPEFTETANMMYPPYRDDEIEIMSPHERNLNRDAGF